MLEVQIAVGLTVKFPPGASPWTTPGTKLQQSHTPPGPT